jgi:hypothetical protein
MPSTSRKQQRLFGLALAYKRGLKTDVSNDVKRLADSMTEEQLKHFTVYNADYKKSK